MWLHWWSGLSWQVLQLFGRAILHKLLKQPTAFWIQPHLFPVQLHLNQHLFDFFLSFKGSKTSYKQNIEILSPFQLIWLVVCCFVAGHVVYSGLIRALYWKQMSAGTKDNTDESCETVLVLQPATILFWFSELKEAKKLRGTAEFSKTIF